MEGLRGKLPDSDIPMPDLLVHEVFDQGPAVLLVTGDEHADVQVGVGPGAHREVVRYSEDINTMGECSLPANILLEGCRGCSPTVDLSVEA